MLRALAKYRILPLTEAEHAVAKATAAYAAAQDYVAAAAHHHKNMVRQYAAAVATDNLANAIAAVDIFANQVSAANAGDSAALATMTQYIADQSTKTTLEAWYTAAKAEVAVADDVLRTALDQLRTAQKTLHYVKLNTPELYTLKGIVQFKRSTSALGGLVQTSIVSENQYYLYEAPDRMHFACKAVIGGEWLGPHNQSFEYWTIAGGKYHTGVHTGVFCNSAGRRLKLKMTAPGLGQLVIESNTYTNQTLTLELA